MYDAIVVGARCAGAPAAMLLARRGCKVLLLDRAVFPSDVPHGHFIHRHGPRRLARWGLLERIVSSGCPAVTTSTIDLGDFPLTARDVAVDGIAFGYGPRRAVLDQLLVQAAVEAGAEFRDGCVVEDLVRDADKVAGVRGHGRDGACFTERARLTIGADGRRSRIAALAGAAIDELHPTAACWYFSYWSGVACEGLEHYCRSDRVVFAHPTSDGLTAVFVGCPPAARPRRRDDVEPHVMETIDRIPAFAGRIREGRREERFLGATDLPNVMRKPFGPGWALVGDAGCHKDPYLALGVCDAFRDAEYLAEAVDSAFGGASDLQDALAAYEARRNAASREDFAKNLYAARFNPPPPEVLAARAAARGDAQATTRLFLAREGLLP